MPIAAVVFDLDDTLIASDRARMRKLRELLGPGADLRRARAVAEECFESYQRGEVSWEEQRRRRWTAIGVRDDRAQLVDDDYRRHYESIRIRPGARALLTALRRGGSRLALISNSRPDYVEDRLRQLKLDSAFDHVFEMRPPQRKPDPEIFRAAVENLRVRAADAVVVGNHLETDILPALAADYRHGYWMSAAAGPMIPRVTRVRSCSDLASLLI